MVSTSLLEELASRVLEVSVDASEETVQQAFRDKSSSWHPDVNDDEDAQAKFVAAQTARDILTGEIDFTDPDSSRSARERLVKVFGEDEVEKVGQETSRDVGYQSSAETRGDPEDYTRADFARASPQEKKEMMKEIALGVETVIIYQSVEGMYKTGYHEEDFFEDVNDYIGEASKDRIDFDDYYQATKDSLRDEVTEQLFINSAEKIQENLQIEYGQGTNIREVARIVAHFMVQGGIDIGDVGRFVGGGGQRDTGPYTRNHPLGGHGRGRRNDPRYTRGGDRYTRR